MQNHNIKSVGATTSGNTGNSVSPKPFHKWAPGGGGGTNVGSSSIQQQKI
jgi:hypothetical protein